MRSSIWSRSNSREIKVAAVVIEGVEVAREVTMVEEEEEIEDEVEEVVAVEGGVEAVEALEKVWGIYVCDYTRFPKWLESTSRGSRFWRHMILPFEGRSDLELKSLSMMLWNWL